MGTKITFTLPGMVLAGLFFVVLGVQGKAQAQETLPTAVGTQILALIGDAITSGDTTALEEALTEMATANPDSAIALANFASRNLPSTLPAGLPANFAETLVVAMATGIVLGAPDMAAEVTAMIGANRPRFAEIVVSAIEDMLAAGGFETAAGGPQPRGGRPGFVPPAPGTGVGNTAENPSTDAASPAG